MSRSGMVNWLVVAPLLAAATAAAGDWPQFHGPNRDNKSADKGLLKKWPKGGPPRIWEATGIGQGYSTVAIAGKRIHTSGRINGKCVITAMDMNGKKVWTRANGQAWRRSYPGTRSTPTVTPDRLLYHLSGIGSLMCLRATDGTPVWSFDLMKAFGGRNITWGLAESPLVVDDKVICTPGGEDVSMVALDRKTGQVAWKCTGAGVRPGYASTRLGRTVTLTGTASSTCSTYSASWMRSAVDSPAHSRPRTSIPAGRTAC